MWIICLYIIISNYSTGLRKTPDWTDFEPRSLPQWYDVAKIGIFVHWGIYAVPAFKSEWFWYLWDAGNPLIVNFTKTHNFRSYESFARNFTGQYFDPDEWAELFFNAGARYVVLTSKHHDGFALFESTGSPGWNSVEIGPHKDIVELLSKSVRNFSMKFGVYYSLLEWHNKIYPVEKNMKYGVEYVENVMFPDLKKIIKKYKPSLLWTDGDWGEEQYGSWRAQEILAWIYNDSSVKDEIVVNDRWGNDARFNHGDFFSGDKERYNPKMLIGNKWENAFTLDPDSWGFRRNMEVMTFEEVLANVVATVSFGGNVLINVGPMKEGIIPSKFRERLLQLGEWLKVNGEAIYGTSPWFYQNDEFNPHVWYTCKKKTYNPERVAQVPEISDPIEAVYAIFLKWPNNGFLDLKNLINPVNDTNYKIYLLTLKNFADKKNSLNYTISDDGVASIGLQHDEKNASVYAWVLKMTS